MYVLIQKRFIFSKPKCKLLKGHQLLLTKVNNGSPHAIHANIGKWRDHPVAVTMYSYMFGALFMGIASLYFVINGQTSEFIIPQEVSAAATGGCVKISENCMLTK